MYLFSVAQAYWAYMEVDRAGKHILMQYRENRPSAVNFKPERAGYSHNDDVRLKQEFCFRTSCAAESGQGLRL